MSERNQYEQVARKKECLSEQRLHTERNLYFNGKMLMGRDLRAEQSYHRSHHTWHQLMLHGWGIVWGLQVKVEREENCVTIQPGMALDCHGRELVLPHLLKFSVAELLESHPAEKDSHSSDKETTYPGGQEGAYPSGKQESKAKAEQYSTPSQSPPQDILIGLQYRTIFREPIPLVLDDGCTPTEPRHNRIEEFARVCWRTYANGDECWDYPRSYLPSELPLPVKSQTHQEGDDEGCCSDLTLDDHNNPDECASHQPSVELVPRCKCGPCGFVPVARLRFSEGRWTADDLGCRYVHSPYYCEALTHIVGINWNHAGETNFQQLVRDYRNPAESDPQYAQAIHAECGGKLARIILKFDRQLERPADWMKHPEAENRYLTQLIKIDFVRGPKPDEEDYDQDRDDPPGVLNPWVVRLSPGRRFLFCDFPIHRIPKSALPVWMRLTLNCDMLVDDRGRAVDGDHLCGMVPNLHVKQTERARGGRSGNGIEGGVFQSWTMLIRHPKPHADEAEDPPSYEEKEGY